MLVTWSLNALLLPSHVDVSHARCRGGEGIWRQGFQARGRGTGWIYLASWGGKKTRGPSWWRPQLGFCRLSKWRQKFRSAGWQDELLPLTTQWSCLVVIVVLCFWAEQSHCSCPPLGLCVGVWGELSLAPQKWYILWDKEERCHSCILTPQSSGGMLGLWVLVVNLKSQFRVRYWWKDSLCVSFLCVHMILACRCVCFLCDVGLLVNNLYI